MDQVLLVWSAEGWAGLGLLKVRRKAQTAFGSNEAAWTQGNASACVMVLPFELAVGDETTKWDVLRILRSDDDLLLCSRCLGGMYCSTILNSLMTTGAHIQLLEQESGTADIYNPGVPNYCFGNVLHHLCHGGISPLALNCKAPAGSELGSGLYRTWF